MPTLNNIVIEVNNQKTDIIINSAGGVLGALIGFAISMIIVTQSSRTEAEWTSAQVILLFLGTIIGGGVLGSTVAYAGQRFFRPDTSARLQSPIQAAHPVAIIAVSVGRLDQVAQIPASYEQARIEASFASPCLSPYRDKENNDVVEFKPVNSHTPSQSFDSEIKKEQLEANHRALQEINRVIHGFSHHHRSLSRSATYSSNAESFSSSNYIMNESSPRIEHTHR